jgi:hypothetical protein
MHRPTSPDYVNIDTVFITTFQSTESTLAAEEG